MKIYVFNYRFFAFEFNGENKDIIELIQSKIKKRNFNKKEKLEKFEKIKLRNKENKKLFAQSAFFFTGLSLFLTYKVCNTTQFLVIFNFVLIFCVKIAKLWTLFSNQKQETENFKKNFNEEKLKNENKLNEDKGNLIRVTSLFEESIENVSNLFNEINNYENFDENVLKAEIDKSKELKGFLYTLSLKGNKKSERKRSYIFPFKSKTCPFYKANIT